VDGLFFDAAKHPSPPSFFSLQIEDHTASAGATTVIWGTNINAELLRSKVESFIWNFKDSETGTEKYNDLIHRVRRQHEGVWVFSA
jgi:hypothetical protein